jgi:hypothetical protein
MHKKLFRRLNADDKLACKIPLKTPISSCCELILHVTIVAYYQSPTCQHLANADYDLETNSEKSSSCMICNNVNDV